MGARVRLPYVPALDGLRGVAVAAVLCFHGGFAWATGGFLGVSAFFTLSGFLITSLLLAEHATTGSISLRAFWARRARRLLPASLAALSLVVILGALAYDADQIRNLRGDVLASILDVANWRFVVTGRSYADLFGAPSPVQHFWSLAIEEQLYLVLPLVVVGLLRIGRGSRRVLGLGLAVLGIASVVAMIAIHHPGEDPSRAYYGTDTRAAELLAGAVLATMWRPGAVAGRAARAAVSATGLVALAWAALLVATVATTTSWLYEGGLVVVALSTIAVVVAAAAPSGPVRALLSIAPLRALGSISYGVYVFHWPIFLWLSPQRTGWALGPLFGLRVAATVALAVLSYHYLESPIRAGRPRGTLVWVPALAAAASVVVGVATVTADAPPAQLVFAAATHAALPVVTGREPAASERPPRVMVVGDSVALTIGRGLERWGARTGRAEVVNLASVGCGLARGGQLLWPGQGFRPPPDACDWTDTFADQIDANAPDVVVVLTGTWDLLDRRRPEWDGEIRRPGDDDFDARLIDELAAADTALTANGARSVWLTAPCAHFPELPDQLSDDEAAARIAHLDEVLLPELAARRPDVAVVDLAARVCPGGRFTDELGGVAHARPDGVHVSDDAADWLARWLGPQVINSRPTRR
jgi:peptidoglycan/LPS O-acetylase OafA/YrhL